MKTVGVLGGMGPKATMYFSNLVIETTKALKDQDHINMLIYNHAEIPDRTDFLLGKSNDNPIPYLISDAKMLERSGCDFLVLTCNTSHFAYDDIVKEIKIPLINMPYEVCKIINNNHKIKKVGLMATVGTIKAGVYERFLKKEMYHASDELNNEVMHLIYDKVKKGKKVGKEEFFNVLNKYFNDGCDLVIMGCTELSVIIKDNNLYDDERIIDAMKVLVDKTIEYAKEKM